jgi:cytochrome c oxidase subunit 1
MSAPTRSTPRPSLFSRPTAETGFWGWVTTVDHKRIAIMYFVTAAVFFFLGGVEALVIRTQLAGPNAGIVSADLYNQMFTMHGLTMIFLGLMPLSQAFFNYLLPLQIGARDVAFPRLNALGYWVFLFGGLFIYSSIFLGGMPDGGWFNYAPLSTVGPNPGDLGALPDSGAHVSRMVFYSIGLQITGIASLAAAVNFIVTILNMRAPGMTLLRLPVFIWMTLVTSFLMLFAMPVIGIALWQLMFDIRFGANFFNPSAGADPILWQHMFWLFGHPEVYILILPAFGIVSEVLPVFSRKPLFGYPAVVFSGIVIGLMGWGVWAHHMFVTGLGPVANTAFGLTTMFIAVPTGVKIFNWLGTVWGGRVRFTTPMLFAIGLVAMFTIGGLSGVLHGIVPSNTQQTDTYFVVAHLHYVLFGGAVFGLLSGAYYWFPKVTGRMLNEGLGKLHFWVTFIGFNLTFFPMHIVGLQGMPRRIYQYEAGMGWSLLNLIETIGAFIVGLSFVIFLVNIAISRRRGKRASADPWDARTVEWMTTSPPPPHNFTHIPQISSRDELWHRKYTGPKEGEPMPVPAGGSGEQAVAEPPADDNPPAVVDHRAKDHSIHMPDPSFYPTIVALGMPIMGYGVLTGGIGQLAFLIAGGVVMLGGIFGWVFEPGSEPEHGEEH